MLSCSHNKVKLAGLHTLRLTCAGEDDKSEEGAEGEGSEDQAQLTAPDHPRCRQDPALLAGKGGGEWESEEWEGGRR